MRTEDRIRIGQRLTVGFEGLTVPEAYRDLVRQYKVGNALLFRRNLGDEEQVRALCAELRKLIEEETGHPPFIMIDEESGSVSRLAHLAGETPSAMAIGASEAAEENALAIGRIIGRRLRAVGINFNLAPVLDCYTNPDNQVCGNRIYSSDPEEVGRLGAAYTRGLHESGVLACGKHFPGHGDTAVDSHLDLPVIDRSADDIRRRELVSFRRVMAQGLDAVMSAHIVLPAFEPNGLPATLSRNVMTGLLREEMGFEGLVLSDGMEMQGIARLFSIPEGTLRALSAGVDNCLICHDPAAAAAACRLVYEAAEAGNFDPGENERSVRRILARKEGLWTACGDPADFRNPGQEKTAEAIMRQAVRVLRAPEGKPLPALGADTVCFGVPMRSASQASDALALDAPAECAAALGLRGGGLLPAEEDLKGARSALVILGRHPDQDRVLAAARELAERGLAVTAVSTSTPRCLDFLPDTVWKIGAWQYDRLALRALLSLLRRP